MSATRCSCLLLATCLALLSAAPARTDDAPATIDPAAPAEWGPLQPNARALLFQIGPDLTVGSFDGATISYKTHRSESSAWRFGLTLNTSFNGRDDVVSQTINDTTFTTISADIDFSSSAIGANAHYLRYMAPVERVSFYLGGGPSINWAHSREERTFQQTGSGGFPVVNGSGVSERTVYTAGLDGVFGVEWFCARRISLLGEYTCSAAYSHEELEDSTQTGPPPSSLERTADGDGFNFRSQGARAGVSVYFN